jgi:hypothetical protein
MKRIYQYQVGDILAEFEGGVDFNDDKEGFATIGLVYTDLVELLASIQISANGLESILKTNRGLTQKETALILVAVENYRNLYDLLSLGGTVSNRDVRKCMRKIFAKVDLLAQLDFLRGNIVQNAQKTQKPVITCTEDPDPLVKSLFGEENT